jgi:predicted  nucleic acid-binding Zn-ribbon protein
VILNGRYFKQPAIGYWEQMMREKIHVLVQLQTIEKEKSGIEATLSQVQGKMAEAQARFQGVETRLAQCQDQIEALKKTYRELDREAQQNRGRQAKSQERLHGVKTNKEYQSLLKEIEELKRIDSQHEDRMLACLYDIETAQSQLAALRVEYQTVTAQVAEAKEKIRQESQENENRLALCQQEWDRVFRLVDPKLYALYRQVRDRIPGDAISGVVGATCQGCHLNIPPQSYNELKSSEVLNFCPHCQRIIYWNGH